MIKICKFLAELFSNKTKKENIELKESLSKAKRELEPIQPVEPDTEPALEPEPLRTAEPIQKPEPKPAPVPIPAPKPQVIPASDAQQLAELEQNNLSFILSPTPAKSYLLINCYEEIKSEENIKPVSIENTESYSSVFIKINKNSVISEFKIIPIP